MKKIIYIDTSEKQIINVLQDVKKQRAITIENKDHVQWENLSRKLGLLIKDTDFFIVGSNRRQNLGLIQLGKNVNLELKSERNKIKAIFEKTNFEKRKIF